MSEPAAVRRITPDLLPSAAELLARAFFTNPAHVYFCPDPERRAAQLEWLLGGNLALQIEREVSFCLAEGPVVNAMGFWTRPDSPSPGVVAKLRAGILAAPLRLGVGGLLRLAEVTRGIERHRERALAGRHHWFLNNMVVRENQRGTGVGTRILGEQLERLSERDPSACAALATQRPENVVFYGRLGFEPVSEETIGSRSAAFPNWIMLRSPAR